MVMSWTLRQFDRCLRTWMPASSGVTAGSVPMLPPLDELFRQLEPSPLTHQRIFSKGRGLFFGRWFFSDLDQWLQLNLAVMIEAGAGGDNVTHDHVFFEATKVIHASASGGFS